MQLSTGFALVMSLVLLTGGGSGILQFLQVERGKGTVLLLLLSILSAVNLRWGGLQIHPASLMLYISIFIWMIRYQVGAQALLTACLGGIGGFFLLSLFGNAREPGLILMVPGLILTLLPEGSRQGSLLGACLSPFAAGLWFSLEEICLFERFCLELGSRMQLDAALAILLIFAFCRGFFAWITPRIRMVFSRSLLGDKTD